MRPVDAVEPDEEGEQKCYSPDPKQTGLPQIGGGIRDEIGRAPGVLVRTVSGEGCWTRNGGQFSITVD